MTDTANSADLPERPTLDGLEEKWSRRWQEEGTYAFDRSKDRTDVYAIDTPPPTVSGELHMGSVYGYAQTDIHARFRRMRGRAVFYPMGWDDNGLPTERRVQNVYGVRCDPSLPYHPGFSPPSAPPRRSAPQTPVSRRNFIELCERLTAEDEQVFEALWRRLGLSVDWSMTYTTIGVAARATSQRAFLRNLARGEAYAADAPTLWDVSFQTAVAQAELEDRERPGAYHRLRFSGPSGPDLDVETTRPELLPACVALVCHPSDERYASVVGGTARTPLFGVEVPIHAHPLADPSKGTGLAMVCTFGDLADVTWWRDLQLATRVVVGRDGRLVAEPPAGVPASAYAPLAGRTVAGARHSVVELLASAGALIGEPRAIMHPVKFYENGDSPLEIVATRQWYLRNGGRDLDLRSELLDRGRELRWVPDHMRHRYEHWVGGLTGDWLISRQRFFGVPIPVWYRLDDAGEPDHAHPLTPSEERLPIDPASEPPDGFTEDRRGKPRGFAADPDVMDTWATSSLTPQIAGGWERDPDLFGRVFPMDLRPQGPEIIRTWLFSSVVRSHLEHGTLPWRHTVINGWILDPDRKKMSKRRGTAVTPVELFEQYGSDAVRYWAASGRPGTDLAFDAGQIKVGRRLATKLLNASRFVLGLGAPASAPAGAPGRAGLARTAPVSASPVSASPEHASPVSASPVSASPVSASPVSASPVSASPVSAALDRSLLAGLSGLVATATSALEEYDHTTALAAAEAFFWTFCDDYIELVKERAYGTAEATDDGVSSARAALATALGVQLRLFAPFLPYVTEEIWSWRASPRPGSVHVAPWPTVAELDRAASDGDATLLALVGGVLGQVRRAKSERRLSMRTEVPLVEVRGPDEQLRRLALADRDLRSAGHIVDLKLIHERVQDLHVTVRL